jgi:glycosyltransferase involved in cell wall biosynthesis
MRLFFDARYIRPDFHDGISRYSTELGTALANITPVTFIISDKRQLAKLPEGCRYVKIHEPTSVMEPFTALILNQYKPDIVFSPMQTMGTAGRKFKLILTTHDLIYYRHRTPPRILNPVIRAGWLAYHLTYIPERQALNGADIVATVSQTTQRQIEQVSLTKRPIIVVPNAPQKLTEYVDNIHIDKKPRNLIYMGSFMPYKNVETLVKGMKYLPYYTLHLLSKIKPSRQAELEKLTPKGAKVVFHNGTTDEDYAKLLANGGVLVTASFDEGYGLPLAESLVLGVPVVVSDIDVFHEVADGGGLYFEPHDPKEFAERVKELDDDKLRQRLSTRGKTHIDTYSWHDSARQLLNAINLLVTDTIDNHGSKEETSR